MLLPLSELRGKEENVAGYRFLRWTRDECEQLTVNGLDLFSIEPGVLLRVKLHMGKGIWESSLQGFRWGIIK